jgi:uncharacterized protein YqeY
MTIKQQIEADLKQAMLAGDKTLVTTLRGLKSAILYVEVAEGSRDSGLAEPTVIALLQKEAKKRQESAEIIHKGGNEEKATADVQEKVVIQKYLPTQLSEDEVKKLVTEQAEKLGIASPQQMGQLIGAVKQASSGAADGALIARLAKEYLAR